MASNINILGIIGIVGAILMIVGVFLAWGQIPIIKATASGWDIFSNSDYGSILDYTFVPLIALIGGILSLVLMIIPTFANTEKMQKASNILGIIALIIAIVVVIFGLLFATQSLGMAGSMMDYIQYGFWLTLIGAIITVIGGIMPIAKNRMG
ncbi:MAG: hypothetical protein E7Z62_08220 [Thermoplasmata archaeon]|nr:hypothetical protein [Thermoplasmata archaeon]